MKRKHKIIIAAMSVIVLVIALIMGISYFAPVERLPQNVKDEINMEVQRSYQKSGIIWYDEHGSEDTLGVWRYVGKYGDCYAFIWSMPDEEYLGYTDFPTEHLLDGLSHPVLYPYNSRVMLYHIQHGFKVKEMYEEHTYWSGEATGEQIWRCGDLKYLKNRESWISDHQLERLTRDIEKIIEDHNK